MVEFFSGTKGSNSCQQSSCLPSSSNCPSKNNSVVTLETTSVYMNGLTGNKTYLRPKIQSLLKGNTTRCSDEELSKWNFKCSVPCNEMPFSDGTANVEHKQVFIDCSNEKPIAILVQMQDETKVQSMPANSKCLSDYILQNCYDKNPVPNIAHYIWFSKREMNFYHFLSFLSASKILKPCLILVHGDFQPYGVYWNLLLTVVPNIIHVHRNPPESVFGIPLGHIEHKADIGRIQALQCEYKSELIFLQTFY